MSPGARPEVHRKLSDILIPFAKKDQTLAIGPRRHKINDKNVSECQTGSTPEVERYIESVCQKYQTLANCTFLQEINDKNVFGCQTGNTPEIEQYVDYKTSFSFRSTRKRAKYGTRVSVTETRAQRAKYGDEFPLQKRA